MKIAALWDIQTQFVPHRRHITSALQSPAGCYVRFEVFTAATSVLRLLITANVVSSLPILVALMTEMICSSETSVLQEPQGVTSQNTAFLRWYNTSVGT
jgi:hypothetical protein